ncbi:LTA synthase family protein [Sulfurimonas sp.]
MQKYQHFNFLLNLLYTFGKLYVVFLLFMSLVRLYIFLYFSSQTYQTAEVLAAFFLGLRLDASVLGYIFLLPTLIVFLICLLKVKFLQAYMYKFSRLYFAAMITLVFILSFGDIAYFSFFGEHATLMIFGIFDDDTEALVRTAFENYNVAFVLFVFLGVLTLLYLAVFKIIKERNLLHVEWGYLKECFFVLSLLVLLALLGRGSFAMFPLAYNTPDPTSNHFLNKVAKSSIFSMVDAYNAYEKSKNGEYDLIKESGYKGKMPEAFRVHTGKKDIDEKNLLKNIEYTTAKNLKLEMKKPNVVVVMMESFGLPILKYQSKEFNIMGRLQKHFKEDTLFTHFISSSNGTVVSLEPTLLNITARPKSTSFAQSEYLNTAFSQASARVYQKAGYETSFIYGGNLSWRNVGNFMSKQGFDHVYGRMSIAKALHKDAKKISHDWGVFDEYLYSFVEMKLKESTKPQFIYVLTTNNHPPYTIPKEYKSNALKINKNLLAHIKGDVDLAKKRFKDYAYALDMAGEFLNNIKESKLANNTLVAITADNNTIEGIMKYDDYYNTTKLIPFYLYIPEYLKPAKPIDTKLASSHKDIFPTLYNLTLSNATYRAIGTNLLDKNRLHCGFNDAGVIISKDGAFKMGEAKTKAQKECQKYYKASLAVTEYLIKSNKLTQ